MAPTITITSVFKRLQFFSKLSKSLVNYQYIGNTLNYERESLAFANFFRLTTVKRTSLWYTTYRL